MVGSNPKSIEDIPDFLLHVVQTAITWLETFQNQQKSVSLIPPFFKKTGLVNTIIRYFAIKQKVVRNGRERKLKNTPFVCVSLGAYYADMCLFVLKKQGDC